MRKIILSMLAVAVLLGATDFCLAQGNAKPLVIVSFAGYGKLMADIDAIGRLGGNPNLGAGLDMMLKLMTQGKGLAGLDAKRPWGALVFAEGQQPMVTYGFLPVSDLKQLIEVAKSNPQLNEAIKLDGDVYEIQAGGTPVYVTQKGAWAVVCDNRENLAKAPADPLKLLGDLPARYDLAVRASIKNLPKEIRDMLLTQVRAGAEVGMQQMPGEGEEDYALRLNLAKQTIQQLTDAINEMDELLLGWSVDGKSNTTYLDFEMTAQPGTKLAAQFAEIKSGKTEFAGLLLPGAAVTANSIGTLTDLQVTQTKATLADMRKSAKKQLENAGLTEDEVKMLSQALKDVFEVIEKTVEGKKTDGGLALLLEPSAVTLVAGTKVVDGAKLDKSLQQLIGEFQKKSETGKALKFGDETYQGIHLHTVSMPTPEQELVPLVGDTLEAVVGIADDKVLAAVGRDAIKTLKKAIDQSKTAAGKEILPLEIAVAVTPIAKFLAEIGDDEQVKTNAVMLAKLLEKADNKDHVNVTAKSISQGFRVRLELEEGLLKALATIGQGLSPMGAPPAGSDN